MNRDDFKRLALVRIQEARTLFRNALYDGAYYLAGYAIECALKACIAKRTRTHDFPDRDTVMKSYTHDLDQLLRVAGLELPLNQATAVSSELEVNWSVVKDWSEEARYGKHTKEAARDMIRAVEDKKSGVLTWLRRRW